MSSEQGVALKTKYHSVILRRFEYKKILSNELICKCENNWETAVPCHQPQIIWNDFSGSHTNIGSY
jgi:hypothetical protein